MPAFEIVHTTTNRYSRPVFLEPHTILLRPRCDAAQTLAAFEFEIQPRPAGLTQSTDLEGNVFIVAWFDAPAESLVVKTASRVITHRRDPFDYIVTEKRAEWLPLNYVGLVEPVAMPYCTPASQSSVVEQFARSIAEQTEWKTLPFLTALSREINESFRQIVREHGDPHSSEETFVRKEGARRDLAVVFIDACRHLGIAGRFVSGYHTIA